MNDKTHITVKVDVKYCNDCHTLADRGCHGYCEKCGSSNVTLDQVAVDYEIDNTYDDYDIPGVDANAD